MTRLIAVGFYLLAQTGDVVVHGAGGGVGVVTPDLIKQLISGNYVALLGYQVA
jgi:NADPH:quinone reductase-like Zn-dependent oxidoreductase